MKLPSNTPNFLTQTKDYKLYRMLINQLNKDFLRANITVNFTITLPPERLLFKLQEIIYELIQNRFSDLLKALYLIDITEAKIEELNITNARTFSKALCNLIIQRECEKVWFKYQYK